MSTGPHSGKQQKATPSLGTRDHIALICQRHRNKGLHLIQPLQTLK